MHDFDNQRPTKLSWTTVFPLTYLWSWLKTLVVVCIWGLDVLQKDCQSVAATVMAYACYPVHT
jgi:hypothetical protein